jgi:alanyl-tRNA synthetase
METIKSYYNDTYCFTSEAEIIGSGSDERGAFITLNSTIFYPQCGGQPSDKGIIIVGEQTIQVTTVRINGDEIRHYTDREYIDIVGKNADLKIDGESRIMNAKSHTAGHLLSNIVEQMYPNYIAIKGHHFPGECYVEFSSIRGLSHALDLDEVNAKINELIASDIKTEIRNSSYEELKTLCPDLPYEIPVGKDVRIMRIGDFAYQPCGGTHIKKLSELNGLSVTKQKIKGETIRINYTLA